MDAHLYDLPCDQQLRKHCRDASVHRHVLMGSSQQIHLGRRETMSLGTPNRAAAAARAREIYLHLLAHGWDETIAKYRPGMISPATQAETPIWVVLWALLWILYRRVCSRKPTHHPGLRILNRRRCGSFPGLMRLFFAWAGLGQKLGV